MQLTVACLVVSVNLLAVPLLHATPDIKGTISLEDTDLTDNQQEISILDDSTEHQDQLEEFLESNLDKFPQFEKILARISGGDVTRPGEIPYQVAMDSWAHNGRRTFCGGALISDEDVLTAAHCLDNSRTVTLYFGAHDLNDKNEQSRKTVQVGDWAFIQHPKYDSQTGLNDLAIIKLNPPIAFTDRIKPVSLPSRQDNQKDFANEQATISGWGYFRAPWKKRSRYLRTAKGRIMSKEECSSYFGGYVTKNQICQDGRDRRGTCHGDDGGPQTITNSRGRQILVGIATQRSTQGCGSQAASVSTRLTKYMHWIKMNANFKDID